MKSYFKELIYKFKELFVLLKKLMLIPKINEALGIRLYRWQIDFIFFDKEIPPDIRGRRANGKTTAQILKVLLSYGEPVLLPNWGTISYIHSNIKKVGRCTINTRNFRSINSYCYFVGLGVDIAHYRFFKNELIKIMNILNSKGIKTTEIIIAR